MQICRMQIKWPFLFVGALSLFWPIDLQAGTGSEIATSQHAVQTTAVLPEGTVIEIRLTEAISTRKNKTGDRFEAVLDFVWKRT